MEFIKASLDRAGEVAALFRSTFTASEGASEGDLIGMLAQDLQSTVAAHDISTYVALEEDRMIGAVIFTRMLYPHDAQSVFLLSPMAVRTDHQGQGIGQALIRHGLAELKAQGVTTVLTYGDINFYTRVGFTQIDQRIAAPPQPLSYPEGWLGQSLTAAPLKPLKGPSQCMRAFDNPELW